MTKREYLESIGYKLLVTFPDESTLWVKYYHFEKYRRGFQQRIYLNSLGKYQASCGYIKTQKDIDVLQITFNNVKRDFEEMQKYGD